MKTKDLIQHLEAHGIDKVYSEEMVQRIQNSNKKIYDAIEDYLKSGREPILKVSGYTCQQLKKKYPQMNTIAALLTLDWLLREPEEAEKAISEGIK